MRNLERDSGTTKFLAWVITPALIRIHHGKRRWNPVRSRQVMVRNDQINSKPPRWLSGRKGANAHIHADDQASPGCRCPLNHVIAHVVSFANAVRHMEIGYASAQFDCGLQDD